MKKLVLIKPVDPHYGRSLRKRGAGVPPVALGILAALTPKDWQVRIIDENSAPFAYAEADLAGLTAFTNTAPRAYQIAQLYRQAGIPTIMGGIHASMLPEEALQYVDCVVLGEAEAVWPGVIADFEAGHLQRTYHGGFPELKDMPLPRYDLFPRGCIGAVQTTRGCPMNCDFCSVTAFNGNRYRHRPVEEVLDELQRIPKRIVAFLDDNIVGHGEQNEQRALALFEGMIRRRLNKLWVGLASMNLADNETVLEYAARSGCLMAMIGVEAEDAAALKEMNKTANLTALKKSYEEVFRRIHKHGIAIHGYFMYGLDVDSPDSLRKRTEFIKACSIDSVGVSIVCPFPGTPLYEKMRREERLRYTNFPQDWVHYDYSQVAHRPKRMSPEMLEQLVSEACREIYGYGAIRARFFRALRATRGVRPAICALRYNLRQRRLKL